MEQRRHRTGNRQGKKKGEFVFRADHNEDPEEDHVGQEGDPFAQPVQIRRMVDAGDEAFDIPPSLAGESGWTSAQDGLLLTAVGLCPSWGELRRCRALRRARLR
jgi:hypothetical protein